LPSYVAHRQFWELLGGNLVKVRVDPDKCQGHTLCAMIAPDAFELDDVDGHSTAIIDGDIPAELQDKVREAARSCPEQAISLAE
jgi:ferredoxin